MALQSPESMRYTAPLSMDPELTSEQGNRGVAAGVARDILGPDVGAEEVVLLAAWIANGAVIHVHYPRPDDPVSPDAMTVRYPSGPDPLD